jgi:2-iminobutanoate/2-iminopropanoate deaminase
MRLASLISLAAILTQALPSVARAENAHIPVVRPPAPAGAPATAAPTAGPPFSAAVLAGDTLYISGATDTDPATGKAFTDPRAGAKSLLDGMMRTLARSGMTMDDLVWVQIFATDLGNYATFNEVYRTYFKGPLPARAFLGAGSLLNNANFEIMGVAVKSSK